MKLIHGLLFAIPWIIQANPGPASFPFGVHVKNDQDLWTWLDGWTIFTFYLFGRQFSLKVSAEDLCGTE